MNFRELPSGPVRAYRVEVAGQKYDAGRPMYPHVHVARGNARVYLPKPTNKYSRSRNRRNVSFTRPKNPIPRPPREDSRYADSVLSKQRNTGRNNTFINFGNPSRALELLRQKTENEKDKQFAVRSFQVPHETWTALRDRAVHERDALRYPTRPMAVDRKAHNQLGLGERHVDLLHATMLPGSAREETAETLAQAVAGERSGSGVEPPSEPQASGHSASEDRRPRPKRSPKRDRDLPIVPGRAYDPAADPFESDEQDDDIDEEAQEYLYSRKS